jgi:methyl-accepting chemotaxis protein
MKLTLRKKILGLIAASVILTALTIASVATLDTVKRGDEEAEAYKQSLLAERKAQVVEYVDMTARLIENLPLEEAKKVVRNLRYGDKGYVWLQDYNNVFLSYVDPAEENKDQTNLADPTGLKVVVEITKIARDKGQGFLNYYGYVPGRQERRPKISYAKGLPSKGWILVSGMYLDDLNEAVETQRAKIRNEVRLDIAEQLGAALAVAALLMAGTALFVSRGVTGPLERVTTAMKNFDNDLTLTLPVATNDEVGELGNWFNHHLAGLNASVSMVAKVTHELHDHAGTISSAISQQSAFAAELSSSVTEMTSTMEELSTSAGQIAQHSQDVVERADRSLGVAKNGASEVEALTAKFNDISADMRANLNEIVALGRKSQEITKIMAIINNIANQTKLIAFNAALEAASAGEAGKRFGVVAAEIRRLADNVVESTEEIEDKIKEILDAVNRLVMSSDKTSQMMEKSQETASQTMTVLTSMVEGVEESTNSARQISLSTQQQQIASRQVLLAIREINQGLGQSTESTEHSNTVAVELADLAEKLKILVNKFKIDPERDSGTRQDRG